MGRFLFECWHGMAVGVQGDGDVRVPEPLLDDLGVDPGGQGQGGVGVTNRHALSPETVAGSRATERRPLAVLGSLTITSWPTVTRDRRTATRARPRSTSAHWRPSSSPRRIPVEAASSRGQTAEGLRRVGVVLYDVDPNQLACVACGQQWQATSLRGHWWHCPNGCNA